ncbi:MAG: hypothetical protein ACOYB7_02520 [Mycobacterium sp.]
MPKWRRDDRLNEIEMAAEVPDASAVLDDAGGLIGWDESEAQEYLAVQGLSALG